MKPRLRERRALGHAAQAVIVLAVSLVIAGLAAAFAMGAFSSAARGTSGIAVSVDQCNTEWALLTVHNTGTLDITSFKVDLSGDVTKSGVQPTYAGTTDKVSASKPIKPGHVVQLNITWSNEGLSPSAGNSITFKWYATFADGSTKAGTITKTVVSP